MIKAILKATLKEVCFGLFCLVVLSPIMYFEDRRGRHVSFLMVALSTAREITKVVYKLLTEEEIIHND